MVIQRSFGYIVFIYQWPDFQIRITVNETGTIQAENI